MAQIDRLVVPSLWYENNPRVIQEAFAAQIPVSASDVRGIAEFVQHDVNGLLFQRGDSADLKSKLGSVTSRPSLLGKLRENIGPVKTMAAEALEMLALYQHCVSSSRPCRPFAVSPA